MVVYKLLNLLLHPIMQNDKWVARWLLLGVAMLMIQVLLGGVTRLTGSGLSITEWNPILGALPPMNEGEWQLAFGKYKQIAQYKFLNQDFSIGDFKFIYFWEWFHRNWARFIGVAFLIPFIIFLIQKRITKAMIPQLLGLFVLGIAQGLIGWIMVASGLNDENLYVSHIRLAIHFISALILIAFTYWFALSLMVKAGNKVQDKPLRKFTLIILCLLMLQLIYGAFMAGLKAATVAPTWPSINGDIIPTAIWSEHWINHPINIHFIHRTLAYVLTILIGIWFYKALRSKESRLFKKYRIVPVILVLIQVLLGIFTVLYSPLQTRNGFGSFEWMAQLHQLVAMILLMSFVWVWYILKADVNER